MAERPIASNVSHSPLTKDEEWQNLSSFISPSPSVLVHSILGRLRNQGAVGVIVENDYLDRDFSEEFSAFYSRVFRRHRKTCRRLHFFSADVSFLDLKLRPKEISQRLTDVAKEHYLGFIVVRPILHAPIGRSVLVAPPHPDRMSSHLLIKSEYQCHLMGARLRVEGVPFVQQDARVGACAQASIWMAARHFHQHHREAWYSMVSISDHASRNADITLAQSIPAGSDGLSMNSMVQALRAIGREPLYYAGNVKLEKGLAEVSWPAPLKPDEIINRYVDSGIPVIVGLAPWDRDQTAGHAVVVVGHCLKEIAKDTIKEERATRSNFCEAFLVHDDQRGYALRMPTRPGSLVGETPYNVAEHVWFIIAPLPGKVFLKAEVAETLAWRHLDQYRQNLDALRSQHSASLGSSTKQIESFLSLDAANPIIARTYLTHGWRYKERVIANDHTDAFKELVMLQDFPRFVWVTEFGTLQDLNFTDSTKRRIIAHTVIDATSGQLDNVLLLHAPGFAWFWRHDGSNEVGPYILSMYPLADDQPYRPRLRGY